MGGYMFFYTAKIYNYNGEAFCLMGKGKLGKQDGVLTLLVPPRLLDDSVTNRFLCIPDPMFRRRHKNEPLAVCIGEERQTVLMDAQIDFTTGGKGWQQYL